MIYKGDVIIDGKEMVLYSTISDYEYPDLETAIHCMLKEDWDKIMKEEDADVRFYKTDIFFRTYDEEMEYWRDYEE